MGLTEIQFYEELRALSQAERLTRDLYDKLAYVVALMGAPAWLVRYYNALVDAINADGLALLNAARSIDPNIPEAILIPRIVLAANPEDAGLTSVSEEQVLYPNDLRVYNRLRPAASGSENVIESQPGQLGFAWLPVLLLGVLIAIPTGIGLYGMFKDKNLDYKTELVWAQVEKERLYLIGDSFGDCLDDQQRLARGGSTFSTQGVPPQAYAACWSAVPEWLQKPTPRSPRNSLGALGWSLIILALGGAASLGIYTYSRSKVTYKGIKREQRAALAHKEAKREAKDARKAERRAARKAKPEVVALEPYHKDW